MRDTPSTGHRGALRRLRLVMAGSGSAQNRLDEIVMIIAAEMSAEVCSVYVLRAGDVLEPLADEETEYLTLLDQSNFDDPKK